MEGWKLRNRISVASGCMTKMNGKFVPAFLAVEYRQYCNLTLKEYSECKFHGLEKPGYYGETLSDMLSRTWIILHSVHSFGSMEEINLEAVQCIYGRISSRF